VTGSECKATNYNQEMYESHFNSAMCQSTSARLDHACAMAMAMRSKNFDRNFDMIHT
jgi:hypothetical protein